MENTDKHKRIEILVNELLKEFQGEPYWKIKVLLRLLDNFFVDNSTINSEIENAWDYPLSESISFSNLTNKD